MSCFDRITLTTAYFPPIEYFFAIANSNEVFIEQSEYYQKQSYRNRCYIYATDGKDFLNIPMSRDVTHKLPIREIKIDYTKPWLLQHERAIVSAYQSSPFFEYYRDDLFPILERKETYLFDLNCLLLEKLLCLVGLKTRIQYTDTFIPISENGDLREVIQPKYRGDNLLHQYKKEKTYYQVFSNRYGFINNLSILDLLSNEGPNSISFLL
ncbi:MAG: WbqC family protein [Bacteroidales bacterium]|nr:WbqC family protein [Bacteroidales bacterium]MDD4670495.1 WbqC family protein [Bacteroidales bacterium]